MDKTLGNFSFVALLFLFGGGEKWTALPGAHSLSVKNGHGKFFEIQINKRVIVDLPGHLSHVRKEVITLWDEGL